VAFVIKVARFVSSFVAAAGGGGPLLEGRAALDWLCVEAFRRKLGRHAGVYAAVLGVITRRQASLRRRLDERRMAELRRIVGDDDLPADFQHMLP